MNKRFRLLDLFCGAGGAACGYQRAGFYVVGVDNKPQKHYCGDEFFQADALTYPLAGFDVIHASPPCQRWSIGSAKLRAEGKEYPDCLTPIRARLQKTGTPYVIENVQGAPLQGYVIRLCGLMFDLKVFRHRFFECSELIRKPSHPSHKGKYIGEDYYSVCGHGGKWKLWNAAPRAISKGSVDEWRDAMGIDWMTRQELTQAIPPAYTHYIGNQLVKMLEAT